MNIKKFFEAKYLVGLSALLLVLATFFSGLPGDIVSCVSARQNLDTPIFSTRICFIPYLQYDSIENVGATQITEKKAPDGMISLMSHTFDSDAYVEVIIIELANDFPASDVEVHLTEYRHTNYEESFTYRPDRLNNLTLTIENSTTNPAVLGLKTFSPGRVVIVPISITIPVDNENIFEDFTPSDFNALPHLALSYHVDTSKEVIGYISFAYKGRNYQHNIYEAESINRVKAVTSSD